MVVNIQVGRAMTGFAGLGCGQLKKIMSVGRFGLSHPCQLPLKWYMPPANLYNITCLLLFFLQLFKQLNIKNVLKI